MEPVDVSDIQDKGMRALALLAIAVGFTRRSAKGIGIFHAPDGYELRLPTNTSIRMSVFQSRLNSIFTHAAEPITGKLVQEIITAVKLDKTHAGRLREKFVTTTQQLELLVEEPMVTKTGRVLTDADVEVLADEAEKGYDVSHLAPPTPPGVGDLVKEPEGPVVREPYIVRYGRKDGSSRGRILYRSNVVEVWTWADGRKTLNCPWCGEARETANGVALHARTTHPNDIPDRRSEWTSSGEVTYVPSQYQDRKPSEAEETINLIRELIGSDDKLITALTMERDEWERRALKAEGDIQALKELLRDE